MAMGTLATAAMVGAALMSYPPTKFMAEKLVKKGRRRLHSMMP